MIRSIENFWNDFYKNIPYEKEYFKDPTQINDWIEAGHNIENTAIFINQTFKVKDFPALESCFDNLKNIEIAFHRLTPGNYLPTHTDKYGFYRKKHNIDDINKVHRYIIFLDHCKDGHLLIVDNQVYNHWRAGDIVGWVGETPHSAINLGIEDRYTLQITGVYDN